MLGSLFGVNSSKRITEEYKGKLNLFFKYFVSIIGLIKFAWLFRQTCRTGTKVGYSDPVILCGKITA